MWKSMWTSILPVQREKLSFLIGCQKGCLLLPQRHEATSGPSLRAPLEGSWPFTDRGAWEYVGPFSWIWVPLLLVWRDRVPRAGPPAPVLHPPDHLLEAPKTGICERCIDHCRICKPGAPDTLGAGRGAKRRVQRAREKETQCGAPIGGIRKNKGS